MYQIRIYLNPETTLEQMEEVFPFAQDIECEVFAGQPIIDFDREAETLDQAIESVQADVRRAGLEIVTITIGETGAPKLQVVQHG